MRNKLKKYWKEYIKSINWKATLGWYIFFNLLVLTGDITFIKFVAVFGLFLFLTIYVYLTRNLINNNIKK